MNPMYKNSGRKLVEGKVCWANLLTSYHYQCELLSNQYGKVVGKIQTLNLQGITVVIREYSNPNKLIAIPHTAYWAWEKLVDEGNVG